MYIEVYIHIYVYMYIRAYVYLLSTYLEGYVMEIVTTGSVSGLLYIYRRFSNVIISFLA